MSELNGRKLKYTLDEVLDAVCIESGCVSRIAARLEIAPKTMYRYMERWSSVADAVKAWRLDTAYLAEGSLRDAVVAGDPWAVQFVLRTQGRELGYGDQSTVEVEATHAVSDDVLDAITGALTRGYSDDLLPSAEDEIE